MPWQSAKSEKLQEAFFPSDLPMCFSQILGNIPLCDMGISLQSQVTENSIQTHINNKEKYCFIKLQVQRVGWLQGQFHLVALDLFLRGTLR